MSGIGIITNPHSKLNRRNPDRPALLGFILGAQGQLEVTNSLADLERVALDFKGKGITTLAINGGDGTVSRTLTAFLAAYGETPLPQIALLRGGTINVLANNLGIRGSPEEILYRLVEWHSSGRAMPVRRVPTLCVEGNHGFLFANGMAPAFLKEYYKRKSGAFGAFLLVCAVWLSSLYKGRLHDKIVQDLRQNLRPGGRRPIDHTSCSVFCSTVLKLPLGVPLFHMLDSHPREFQCVSFTTPSRESWRLPLVLLRRQDDLGKDKISFCCEELQIEMPHPFDYTLDGELFTSTNNSVNIGIGPELDFVTI